jgi:hypothetical protein
MSYLQKKLDKLLCERPPEQEPYGVLVAHKNIPNAVQEFVPIQFYRNHKFGDDYSKVPVYTKPALTEEDRDALEVALIVLDHQNIFGRHNQTIARIQALLSYKE